MHVSVHLTAAKSLAQETFQEETQMLEDPSMPAVEDMYSKEVEAADQRASGRYVVFCLLYTAKERGNGFRGLKSLYSH